MVQANLLPDASTSKKTRLAILPVITNIHLSTASKILFIKSIIPFVPSASKLMYFFNTKKILSTVSLSPAGNLPTVSAIKSIKLAIARTGLLAFTTAAISPSPIKHAAI